MIAGLQMYTSRDIVGTIRIPTLSDRHVKRRFKQNQRVIYRFPLVITSKFLRICRDQ